MLFARPRRAGFNGGRMSKRDQALCEELKKLAAEAGLEVREEPLQREVGYHVRGGACRLRGRELVLLDRSSTPAEKVAVLVEALAGKDTSPFFVTPALRRVLDARARQQRARVER